nr:MAG TPA: hypothetical protein [Caudoviricetes sp.]
MLNVHCPYGLVVVISVLPMLFYQFLLTRNLNKI